MATTQTTSRHQVMMTACSEGGEGGIRTLGTIAGTHDFQSCSFDHSDTSPLYLAKSS